MFNSLRPHVAEGAFPDVIRGGGNALDLMFSVALARGRAQLGAASRGRDGADENERMRASPECSATMFKPRDIFLHDGKTLRRVRVELRSPGRGRFRRRCSCSSGRSSPPPSSPPPPQAPSYRRRRPDGARARRDAGRRRRDQGSRPAPLPAHRHRSPPPRPRSEPPPGRATAVGGPYEPVETVRAADPNFKALFNSWTKLDQLEQGTVAIPSAEPVHGTNFTSGFGVRSDPFRGRAAMHAGIDLAGPIGTPIYATADGLVGRSEWNSGGYGNLVELDHGHGIQTRYGHLSKSMVAAGQRVKRGDMIALMGSTGRSTGSHLHYEVRIDGKAVNPVPFMQSTCLSPVGPAARRRRHPHRHRRPRRRQLSPAQERAERPEPRRRRRGFFSCAGRHAEIGFAKSD